MKAFTFTIHLLASANYNQNTSLDTCQNIIKNSCSISDGGWCCTLQIKVSSIVASDNAINISNSIIFKGVRSSYDPAATRKFV